MREERPPASSGAVRVVLATAALIILAGVGLFVVGSDPPTQPARETQSGGPLESVRWSVSTAALAAGDRTPPQLRSVGEVVVVAHGATIEGIEVADGTPLWSRPAAHEERLVGDIAEPDVVVTAHPRPDDRYLLTALDPTTGVTLWRRDVDAPQLAPIRDESPSAPAVPGIHVTPGAVIIGAVAGGGGRVHGIDLHDGEDLWVEDLPGDLVHADASLAVFVDERDDGEPTTLFTVVDLRDGTTAWTTALPAGGIDVRPSARVVPGGPIVTADAASGLRGHRRTDGDVIWARTDVRRGEFLSLSAEEILVTQDRTRAYVGIDAADGFVRWRHDWLVPGPIAITTGSGRAIVVSADEQVAALGLEHGTRTWEERFERAAAVTVAAGTVVHTDHRGRLSGRSVTTGRHRWSSVLADETRVGLVAAGETALTTTKRGTTPNHEIRAWVDGEPRWSTEVRRSGLGPPLVTAGRLLLQGTGSASAGPDGTTMTALDAMSGAELWTTDGGEASRWLPALSRAVAAGDRVVGVLPDRVTVYDLTTGAVHWERTGAFAIGPILLGGNVVVGDRDRTLIALDLLDGRETWRGEVASVLTLAGEDDRAYAVTEAGQLVALDRQGGKIWTTPLPGVSHHPPVEIGDTVVSVVGSTSFGFARSTGGRMWEAPLPGPLAGPPVTVDGGVLVATTDGTISLLAADDGRTLDLFLLGPVHAGPVTAGGTTYVVTVAGELVALGPRDPEEEAPSAPPIHPR